MCEMLFGFMNPKPNPEMYDGGGGGGDWPVWVGYTGATDSQRATLQAAFNDALKRLTNPDCGALYAGDRAPAAGPAIATDTLETTQYQIGQFGGIAAAQPGDVVQINSTGLFFQGPNASTSSPGNVGITVPSPTDGTPLQVYLSPSDLGAFILLHELGHEVGIFGDDKGDSLAQGQHSWAVLENCFGMQPPQ